MKKTNPQTFIALLVISSFFVLTSSLLIKAVAASKSEKAIPEQVSEGRDKHPIASNHRSVVSTFVQNLTQVADNEAGGIGEQVRLIAQQQDLSGSEVSGEIAVIEDRGKIKTFLIGSDYKNLGALRSEMVQTRNRIDQLQKLADKATTEEDKIALQDQITALGSEQTIINKFVTDNESKFSLFGWFVKLLK